MKTVYPSRVDWWLAALLIGAPMLIIALGLHTLNQSMGAGLVLIVSGLAIGALIAALACPCDYTLTDEHLTIRAGLLNETLPLHRIRTAVLSTSPLSAPALSLRRIKLTLDEGSRLISPRNRDAFIADLEQRRQRLPAAPPFHDRGR